MILEESEVLERLESPNNLINRLRNELDKHVAIPTLPPTSDEVVKDLEEKIKYGGLKSKATAIMNTALKELETKVIEVAKPRELAAIAETMSKIINSESEKKEDKPVGPQIIMYAPKFINESAFETIYVRE